MGEFVLVGKVWNPGISTWHEQLVPVPRKDDKMKDPDDFTALKRLTDDLIKNDELTKSVSVHNLSAMASMCKPTIINCMWPNPDHGYQAKHLLEYGAALRRCCYCDELGNICKMPINLIGYSTDSAVFPWQQQFSR